jgi:hypothetical protein
MFTFGEDRFKSLVAYLSKINKKTTLVFLLRLLVRVAGLDGVRYALPSTATIVFTFGEDRFKSLGMFLSKIIKKQP